MVLSIEPSSVEICLMLTSPLLTTMNAIGDLRDGNNLYAVAQIHGIADDRADINKILYLFD